MPLRKLFGIIAISNGEALKVGQKVRNEFYDVNHSASVGWLVVKSLWQGCSTCGISQVSVQPAIMRVFQNMASSIYMYTLMKNHIEEEYNYAVTTSLPTCAMLSRISSGFTSLMPT